MRTIAVYPGRFHPFHKGHASSFKQLAKTFGLENTFLAISQKQEQPKSPFSAKDRAKMAVILGIPMQNILFVRNTYGGDEYMQQLESMGVDVNDTALVLGVSGKDMGSDPRFSFSPKKDGSASYLQPADNGIEAPMTQHAYIMTTDVAPFNIAGMAMTDASQIRSAYAKGDEELQNKILTDLYGKGAKHVKPIFDQNLAIMESIYNKLVSLKQRITESKQGVMEGSKCPPATQDITLNLKNRQKAIDEYGYGPLNPDMPNNKFWMKKVDEWNLDTVEEAKESLCGNCAAFDIRQDTLDCIASGIDADNPEDAEGVIDAGELGYCKFLKFKCASRRTCDAWVTGGPLTDKQDVEEDQLDEACWKGYHKEGMKTMFGKRYPNCVKNKNESLETYIKKGECPGCGEQMVAESQLNEKQDACYHKVKSRYKVWPSAYASGALVQCRKKGASNWGNKSNESITQEEYDQLDENLKQWFSDKWVRFGPDGKIRGACARGDDSEGKPKCLPQSKAQSLGKKGRASAAARKRREDPNPERSGKAINVNTKKKSNEDIIEAGSPAQQAAIAINMKKRHQKPKNISESRVTKITDYELWSDEVKELGGEIYPQKDRNVLVAQSWDGEEIGKFHLGKGYGFISQSGELDETIRKMGSQYRLLSKKGKNLGTFDSKAGAEKHEREVQYFKHMKEGEDDQFDLEKRHPLDQGIKRLMVRKLARKTGYETSALELASDEELTELYNEVFPKEDYLDE